MKKVNKIEICFSVIMILLCIILFYISDYPTLNYSFVGAEQIPKYVSFFGMGFWLNVIVVSITKINKGK